MSSKNKGRQPSDFKPKAQRGVTSAAAWGNKKTTFELELPSGNVVLMKRVDMPTLLASGAFPDSLMAIVSEKINSATGKNDTPTEMDPKIVKDTLADPKKLAELFDAIDRVLPIVVAEPVVFNHKQLVLDADGSPVVDAKGLPTGETEIIPDEQRIDDAVYTDQVDLEDKMHIFQFTVGGTRDVETFRGELESTVADLSAS